MKLGHGPQDYLQEDNVISPNRFGQIKSKQMCAKGIFQSGPCHKGWGCLLVCGFSSLSAPSPVSPVEQIGLYWAEAVELVLDRCVAYAPQGAMVLKKGCVYERDGEREKILSEEADGWVTQCSNIPGQWWGAHCWLFACNNCSHISYSHISCFSGWMMCNRLLCVTPDPQR